MSTDPEQDLTEVEREIWELQRLLAQGERLAPAEVTRERRDRLQVLLRRRGALEAQIQPPMEPVAEAVPAREGLWEPLALHPAVHAAAPPAPSELRETPALLQEREEHHQRLAQFYLSLHDRGSGPKKNKKALSRAILSPDPRVLGVALSVAEDFGYTHMANFVREHLGQHRVPLETPPASDPPRSDAPGLDGFTSMQRRVLQAFMLQDPLRDRLSTLDQLARALSATGEATSAETLMTALAPLTLEGGARYPIVTLNRDTSLALTAFGKAVLAADEATGRLSQRLPLLVLLGHRGSPLCPSHNLGEVVRAIGEAMRGEHGYTWMMPAPDFSHGGVVEASSELSWLYLLGDGRLTWAGDSTVAVAPGGYRAQMRVGPLAAGASAEDLERFLVQGQESYEIDRCSWARTTDDRWTIELSHVASVNKLLRALDRRPFLRRSERVAFRAHFNGQAATIRLRQLLDWFIADELRFRDGARSSVRGELGAQLRLAEGLVIAASLHTIVDRVIAAAETPAEAVWALTNLRDPSLLEKPSFQALRRDFESLEAQREALRTEFPRLGLALDAGFSPPQASALLRERRLGSQRATFVRRWQDLCEQHERFATEPAERQLQARLSDSLAELASRFGDDRRTRLVRPLEGLWPWRRRR